MNVPCSLALTKIFSAVKASNFACHVNVLVIGTTKYVTKLVITSLKLCNLREGIKFSFDKILTVQVHILPFTDLIIKFCLA